MTVVETADALYSICNAEMEAIFMRTKTLNLRGSKPILFHSPSLLGDLVEDVRRVYSAAVFCPLDPGAC